MFCSLPDVSCCWTSWPSRSWVDCFWQWWKPAWVVFYCSLWVRSRNSLWLFTDRFSGAGQRAEGELCLVTTSFLPVPSCSRLHNGMGTVTFSLELKTFRNPVLTRISDRASVWTAAAPTTHYYLCCHFHVPWLLRPAFLRQLAVGTQDFPLSSCFILRWSIHHKLIWLVSVSPTRF